MAYKILALSSKNPLDVQLKKLGHPEGYVINWNIKQKKFGPTDSLYKGHKKMYEIRKDNDELFNF